ncbi:hypothetical protein DENSPDRAFT_836216, partial [Dentipellis sp. KUC8613]
MLARIYALVSLLVVLPFASALPAEARYNARHLTGLPPAAIEERYYTTLPATFGVREPTPVRGGPGNIGGLC